MVRCFSITYQEVIVTMSETKSEAPSIQLIAHRGYSGRYPENTLLAYEAAVQHGAQCFELDLQMSNDGVPFLHHDETLMRMAGLDQDLGTLTQKRSSLCEPLTRVDSEMHFLTINSPRLKSFASGLP